MYTLGYMIINFSPLSFNLSFIMEGGEYQTRTMNGREEIIIYTSIATIVSLMLPKNIKS